MKPPALPNISKSLFFLKYSGTTAVFYDESEVNTFSIPLHTDMTSKI